jgi:hypothetical protein
VPGIWLGILQNRYGCWLACDTRGAVLLLVRADAIASKPAPTGDAQFHGG